MMKLNILNMKNFLCVINNCEGKVNMLCTDGKKLNINGQSTIQDELLKRYKENKNCLKLILDVQNLKDYMAIVSYYAGDC